MIFGCEHKPCRQAYARKLSLYDCKILVFPSDFIRFFNSYQTVLPNIFKTK